MAVQSRHLRDAVGSRADALHLDLTALVARSGLSRETWRHLLAGEQRAFKDDTKWRVCRTLQWSDDSLDRIAAGSAPVELEPEQVPVDDTVPNWPWFRATAQATAAQAEANRVRLEAMQDQLDEMLVRLAQLGAAQRRDGAASHGASAPCGPVP